MYLFWLFQLISRSAALLTGTGGIHFLKCCADRTACGFALHNGTKLVLTSSLLVCAGLGIGVLIGPASVWCWLWSNYRCHRTVQEEWLSKSLSGSHHRSRRLPLFFHTRQLPHLMLAMTWSPSQPMGIWVQTPVQERYKMSGQELIHIFFTAIDLKKS